MARQLHRVKIAPKGMGLNDFVAMQEGYFAAEGLDVELDWKTFRGTQSSWKGLEYLQRPQDRPYTQDKSEVIQGACVWGSICNASAGMGRFVADAYGISPWAIFVRPDSRIRTPQDLKDVAISVGMRAGSDAAEHRMRRWQVEAAAVRHAGQQRPRKPVGKGGFADPARPGDQPGMVHPPCPRRLRERGLGSRMAQQQRVGPRLGRSGIGGGHSSRCRTAAMIASCTSCAAPSAGTRTHRSGSAAAMAR